MLCRDGCSQDEVSLGKRQDFEERPTVAWPYYLTAFPVVLYHAPPLDTYAIKQQHPTSRNVPGTSTSSSTVTFTPHGHLHPPDRRITSSRVHLLPDRDSILKFAFSILQPHPPSHHPRPLTHAALPEPQRKLDRTTSIDNPTRQSIRI